MTPLYFICHFPSLVQLYPFPSFFNLHFEFLSLFYSLHLFPLVWESGTNNVHILRFHTKGIGLRGMAG